MANDVARERIAPANRSGDGAGIRVEQQLRRIEPVACLRSPGSVHPVPVQLTGLHVGQVSVPDHAGTLPDRDPQRLTGVVGALEET
jgi:hypothetical protein